MEVDNEKVEAEKSEIAEMKDSEEEEEEEEDVGEAIDGLGGANLCCVRSHNYTWSALHSLHAETHVMPFSVGCFDI